MSPFEYVIVLVSIILGLGITTILTGVADWIKHRPRGLLYIPYVIWIVLVFILHIHEWWESYSYRTIEEWKLPMFLYVMLYPINLYLLAHLLFPKNFEEDVDGRKFYLSHWNKLFTGALTLIIISVIQNVALSGYDLKSQAVHFVLAGLIGFLVYRRSNNEKLHYTVAIILFLVMIGSIITVRESLVIGN